jgi:hypothetical protein
MPKANCDERIKLALACLQKKADSLKGKRISEFGFADRMAIERELFELLKQLCILRIGYQLQGLGDIHREALLKEISSLKCDLSFRHIAQSVFELRAFMQTLTSNNAYVRDEAISNAGTTSKHALGILGAHLNRFIRLINAEVFGI